MSDINNWPILVRREVVEGAEYVTVPLNIYQIGNLLDLFVNMFDLGLQYLVFPLLPGYLGLIPEENDTGKQTTHQDRGTQTQIEYVTAKFARRFAMR